MRILSINLHILTFYWLNAAEVTQDCKWPSILLHEVANLSVGYHVVLVLPNHMIIFRQCEDFIQGITRIHPTITVNPLELKNIPYTHLTRNKATFIILFETNDQAADEKYVTKSLDNILVKENEYQQRPKCLLILFYNGSLVHNMRNTMQYAWSKFFLDFTIISVNVQNICSKLELKYFNPFKKSYHHYDFYDHNKILFPNKLINVNYHNLTIRISRKKKMDYVNQPELFISLIAMKKMNFSINFLKIIRKEGTRRETLSTSKVDIDFFTISANNQKKYLYLNINQNCEKVVAVVPLHKMFKLNNFINTFNFLGVLIVMTILVFVGIKMFRCNAEFWNAFNVINTLMGVAIEYPRTSIQKIGFICCTIISIIYCADFYSDIISIYYTREMMTFNTFEKLDESSLIPHARQEIAKRIFREMADDAYVSNIKRKIKIVESIRDCFKLLSMRKPVFCIGIEQMVVNKINKNSMKIAEPSFACNPIQFIVHFGSPYYEDLQRLIYKLLESGIRQHLDNLKNQENANFDHNEIEEIFITSKILTITLVIGYCFSFLIFIYELIRKWFELRKIENNPYNRHH